jgi:hypothetical protein
MGFLATTEIVLCGHQAELEMCVEVLHALLLADRSRGYSRVLNLNHIIIAVWGVKTSEREH